MYNSNIYKNFTKRQKEIDVFCEYYKDFLSKTKTSPIGCNAPNCTDSTKKHPMVRNIKF